MSGEGERATFTTNAESHLTVELRRREMDLQFGWLGKAFGSQANAPTNIAGFLAVLLLLSGIWMVIYSGWDRSAEYWKVITPLLSLVLGFLFGKNS